MTERVQRLIDFFRKNKNYVPSCGIFNCRNTMGDSMHTIYDELADGVVVDICYDYDYIEIFGLTDDEFTDALRAIDAMSVSPWENDEEDNESECSDSTKMYVVRVREDDGRIVDIAAFTSQEEAEKCAKCVESDFGIRNLYIMDYKVYHRFVMLDVDQFTDIKTRIDSVNQ